jgi:predicted ABC-type sugar transport system permease subunit
LSSAGGIAFSVGIIAGTAALVAMLDPSRAPPRRSRAYVSKT